MMNTLYNFCNFLDHPDVAYQNFKQMIRTNLDLLSVVRWAVTSKTGNFLEIADPNIQVKGIIDLLNPNKTYEKIKEEYDFIKKSTNKLQPEAIFEAYENVLTIHRIHKNSPLDIAVLFLDDLKPEQLQEALLKAIKCGFTSLSEKIINTPAYNQNLNMNSNEFLLLAVKKDNLGVVKELLKNKNQLDNLNNPETIQKLVTLCYTFRLTQMSAVLIDYGMDYKEFSNNSETSSKSTDIIQIDHISNRTLPNHPINELVKKIEFNDKLIDFLPEKNINVESTAKKRKI